jgi:hypothetical protein
MVDHSDAGILASSVNIRRSTFIPFERGQVFTWAVPRYGNSADGMRARMMGTLRASPFEFGVLS